MEQNEQPHTAHDGSTSPVHLSPSPPATADVGTPTKGSPTRPARPPPPKFPTNKQSDYRPPRPLRPSAKSLSLPRGMRPMAAETARARAAKRRSVDDSSVPRAYTRPLSFPGFDSEEREEPKQLVELDQLVKEASKPVTSRPSQPSDTSRPRKPSDLRDSPEKASITDTPVKSASPVPPPGNLKSETSSNGTSARTPPTSKPPSRPPRPFPPPTSAQLTARVAKKRPPPVLVSGKKSGEQGGTRPAITVIDTRSNDQASTDNEEAKLQPSGTSHPSPTTPPPSSPSIVLSPPPSSPPHVPPPPSRSTPPASTVSSLQKDNHPLASAVDKPKNLPLIEQPKTTGSTAIKTSSSASAVPQLVEVDDGVTDGREKSKETQESESEEKDTLSPMTEQTSPRSKGRRLLNSMKKSLRLGGGRHRHSSAPGRSKTITSSPKAMHRSFTTRESSSHKVYDRTVYPDTLPQGVVSPLVVQCVAYLNREHILKEEGLFRIPGDLAAIKKIRQHFIAGDEVDLIGDVFDPHTVAGLLKLHFREMRVSLIARGQTMAEAVRAVQKKQVDNFREIVQNLDSSHILTLRMLAELLCKISSYSDINHMTSGTLATSCGPSIFPYLPPSNANAIVKFLIDHCNEIFTD